MNKLLTEQELEYELQGIFYPEIKHFVATKKYAKIRKAVSLIQSQKQAHADMVKKEALIEVYEELQGLRATRTFDEIGHIINGRISFYKGYPMQSDPRAEQRERNSNE